jgi:protein-L-isoaspartate O-methyltransferase
MRSAPERVVWAVEALAPRPRERVLEIGCGNAAAAELLLVFEPPSRKKIRPIAEACSAKLKRLARSSRRAGLASFVRRS